MIGISMFIDTFKSVFFNENGSLNFFGKILISALIAFVSYIIVTLVDKVINDKLIKDRTASEGNSRISTAASILNSFVKVFVYSFAVLVILDFVGVNIKSILTVAGIGGITVAFASQSIVKDVINGAFLLFENQYDIGDWIEIKGKAGTVIDIGLRTVKLQDIAGQVHMIPNGQIDIVTNYSKNHMKAIVDISLRVDVDIDEAWQLIDQTLEQLKKEYTIFLTRPVILGVMKVDDYSYTIKVNAFTNIGEQWEAERIIRRALLKSLQKEGLIKIHGSHIGEKRKRKDGKI